MMNSIAVIDPSMLALMRGACGREGLPLPFAKEIFLMDCQVAGTSFQDLADIEPGLSIGSPVVFKREPGNPHDPLAISIFDEKGNKLGYIPRHKNEVLAHLMDSGKLVYGILTEKEWESYGGLWLKLNVKISMRDM